MVQTVNIPRANQTSYRVYRSSSVAIFILCGKKSNDFNDC
ncbi:hypothetical protein C427_0803 [Paraglaciecola psychrophila 170]|uniref:Uncharacterized protein n=1 Tax=Paraglaciecola psychrophila 170 TaxID=1129794 RepID=K7ACW5_9ALTE|nr:hypothetical protein C427_0803 [Paraglaciecola psychrophila 170]GAC40112.1 hypothetical protein GPSY_4509 [Paraglaciecola psychrophila 170]